MLKEARQYPQKKNHLLNVIGDMMELQHGKGTALDSSKGQVCFITQMYGFQYEYRFFVDEDGSGCTVQLEMSENATDTMMHQAFSLLESLMAIEPKHENDNDCACSEQCSGAGHWK